LARNDTMTRISQQSTAWKRMSLKAIDNAQSPPSTTALYVTYFAELRSDQDINMFNIDNCYMTLDQANARVDLLGHANTSLRSVETKLMQTDHDTGVKTMTFSRHGSQARFIASAKKFDIPGLVLVNPNGDTSPGGHDPESKVSLFLAETELDLADHIWVVAIYRPGAGGTESPEIMKRVLGGRTRSVSAHERAADKNSPDPKTALNTIALCSPLAEENGCVLSWSIECVLPGSDLAMAYAKKAWNDNFKDKGRCKEIREHCGFARYVLKPALMGKNASPYDTCVQLRIERLKVVAVDEKPEYFIPPRPQYIAAFLKIRQRHEKRMRVLEEQHYGAIDGKRNDVAQMYHAFLQRQPVPITGLILNRLRSKAYIQAQVRMDEALRENALEFKGIGEGEGTTGDAKAWENEWTSRRAAIDVSL
jgi:hypothetical protein